MTPDQIERGTTTSLAQDARQRGEIHVGATVPRFRMLKRRLIAAGMRSYQCAGCGISNWRGKPIGLQLDHRNGIGDDKCRERDLNPHGVSPASF